MELRDIKEVRISEARISTSMGFSELAALETAFRLRMWDEFGYDKIGDIKFLVHVPTALRDEFF